MNGEQVRFWFLGLFEGEGTVNINQGKAKGLIMTSTDLDVLERVQRNFGGAVFADVRHNKPDHHKQAYKWSGTVEVSKGLLEFMIPYLSERRRKRAEEWLVLHEQAKTRTRVRRERTNNNKEKVLAFKDSGLLHREIAERVGLERSYVSKILKMPR